MSELEPDAPVARLPLAGRWLRTEVVTPALTIHQAIRVEQTPGGSAVYEVPEHLFERLLTEAGYVRETPERTSTDE